MRALKRDRIKKGSDYPRFEVRFRDEKELDTITQVVDEVTDLLNKKLKEDEKRFTKKEVVMMLLEEGAKVIKKSNLRRG